MVKILIALVKSIFTEAVIKALVIALGDYLVESSKNKLDNKLWAQVKKALNKK